MAVTEVTRLVASIGADTTGLLQGLQQADAKISGFTKAMNYALAGGAVMGAIGAAGAAIDAAFDFSEAGRSLINLEAAFQRMAAQAGTSGDVVLASMTRASQGMISQADLMQSYTRTFLLSGQEMATELPRMIALAQRASQAGMGDFSFLLDSLVTGIGRVSPMIIDNLGFTVSLADANKEYADSLGIAADELTKAQQQQALWNAIVVDAEKKLGDLDAAADAAALGGVARLRASWADLSGEIKTEATPAIDSAAGALATWMDLMSYDYASNFTAMLTVAEQVGIASGIAIGGMIDLTDTAEIASWAAAMSQAEFNAVLERTAAVSPEAARGLEAARTAGLHLRNEQEYMINTSERLMEVMGGVGSAADGAGGSMSVAESIAADLASSLDLVTRSGESAAEALGRVATVYTSTNWRGLAGISKVVDPRLVEGLVGGLRGIVGEEPYIGGTLTEVEAKIGLVVNALDAAERAQAQAAASGASAWNSLQSAMESYYHSWQSQASAVLAPTQAVDFTALEEELGMRQEAFDENARRAMAVAQRGPEAEAQWAGLLGLGSREEALQYVKDFYAGALPEEAYNWEAAITQYQQQIEQIVGQQNLQAIFEQKLVEAGWGPENAMVMQALEAPFAPSGTDSAQIFADSFTDHDWDSVGQTAGKAIVDGVSARLEKRDTRFTSAMEGLIVDVVKQHFFGGAEP